MAEEFSWDDETYTESSSGEFIDKDLFALWANPRTKTVVFVTGIRDGVSTYNGKTEEQWLVDFVGPDGEDYTKGWSKTNEERNARMLRVRATLEANPDEPFPASFGKVGKRYDLMPPRGEY